MLAEQSLRDGDVEGALTHLQDAVRKDPANAKLRIFLFQLLTVMGRWERAMTQLNLSGEMDPGALAMVQTYREALKCEALREEVFDGGRSPLVFGKPTQWIALLLEALKLSGQGATEKAKEIRAEAFELAPATSGQINGEAFEWIADADQRLGPVLEAVVNGSYYWVPFHRIKSIVVEEPGDLRDRVWMPAYLTWANGGQTVGLIPTRYPKSYEHQDGHIALSAKTEWVEVGPECYHGWGQRLLATDAGDYPLMDVRSIELNCPLEEEGEGEAEAADG